MLRHAMVASVILQLAGCGGGSGDGGDDGDSDNDGPVDLDDDMHIFAAERLDQHFILYTWPDQDTVLIDVKTELNGATEGQYDGTRSGDPDEGYDLDLECLNVGSSPVCDEWGASIQQSCIAHDDGTLGCDDFFFRPISADDLE